VGDAAKVRYPRERDVNLAQATADRVAWAAERGDASMSTRFGISQRQGRRRVSAITPLHVAAKTGIPLWWRRLLGRR
jgi:hypothetical protein